MEEQKIFWNGVTYCPFVKSTDLDSKYWERDLLTMRKLGINMIRPFVAWDRIEQVEGVRDYSALDKIFDLCEKHGIGILLNFGGALPCFGGAYAPRFLVKNPKVQKIVYDPRVDARQFGPVRTLCQDDPIYHKKVMEFLDDCAKRYCNHPALVAWDLWNEAFYKEDGCFCPITMTKYRNFLKKKYVTLENLNTVLGGEFPTAYESWDEVEPVKEVGFSTGGALGRKDWIEFNRLRVKGWIDDVEAVARRNNPRNLPITTNVATTAPYAWGFQHSYPSLFDQNRDMDIAGFSAYTAYAEMEEIPWLSSMGFAMARSSSVKPGSFWALESAAGQISYLEKHKARATKEWRNLVNYQLLAQGAKAVMFWKFGGRVDSQTDEYNLCGFDGSITERAELFGKFNAFCQAHSQLLLDCTVQSKAAILYPTHTEYIAIAEKVVDPFFDSAHGAYRILHDLNIPCDFIDDEWCRRGRLSQYKLLLVPYAKYMSKEEAGFVSKFIEDGGTVIADRWFGYKDDFCVQFQRVPGHGLQEYTGAYLNDVEFADCPECIRTKVGELLLDVSDEFHSHLLLTSGEALADFDGGHCAVSLKKHSSGGALMFWGVELFQLCRKKKDIGGVLSFISKFLASQGIESPSKVEGVKPGTIEIAPLYGKNGKRIYVITNMIFEPVKGTFIFADEAQLVQLSGDRKYCGTPVEWELKPFEAFVMARS